MGQVPICRDSTRIHKADLMFSVECYEKEIRIVEVRTDEERYPRLCLIDRTDKDKPTYLFLEINTDAQFDELWSKLETVAKPLDTRGFIEKQLDDNKATVEAPK